MKYIHTMSGARREDDEKILQDWIVNVMTIHCKWEGSAETDTERQSSNYSKGVGQREGPCSF